MIERIYHCDGPHNPELGESDSERCSSHQRTMRDHAPPGWKTVLERGDEAGGDLDRELNFCGWDCVLRFAAKIPPPEILSWEDAGIA